MPAAKDEVSASLEGGITLRPYQRQSLAFMLQNERSNAGELLGRRSVLKQHKAHGSSYRRRWMEQEALWQKEEVPLGIRGDRECG